MLLFLIAFVKTVLPRLSLTLTSAPKWNRTSAQSMCPKCSTRKSGVQPSGERQLGSNPCLRASKTRSADPRLKILSHSSHSANVVIRKRRQSWNGLCELNNTFYCLCSCKEAHVSVIIAPYAVDTSDITVTTSCHCYRIFWLELIWILQHEWRRRLLLPWANRKNRSRHWIYSICRFQNSTSFIPKNKCKTSVERTKRILHAEFVKVYGIIWKAKSKRSLLVWQ